MCNGYLIYDSHFGYVFPKVVQSIVANVAMDLAQSNVLWHLET